jgi:hypothetical protein
MSGSEGDTIYLRRWPSAELRAAFDIMHSCSSIILYQQIITVDVTNGTKTKQLCVPPDLLPIEYVPKKRIL